MKPRFAIQHPHVQEGQKHDQILFCTDVVSTVRFWLGLDDHFCVFDSATGRVLRNADDFESALAAVPLVQRDWSIYGDVNDLDDFEFDDDTDLS